MLPAQTRMRHASDFRDAIRGGVRAARPTLVVHARTTNSPPSQVGFVVSKAVGNAVTRNRVKRRLRHLVLPLVADAEASRTGGLLVVVRALPAAATEPERLADDLAQAWRKSVSRLDSRAVDSPAPRGSDATPKGRP